MSTKYANVPRIDISPLFGSDAETKLNVAKQIDAACRDTGFFLAANHGIDVQEFHRVTRKFHETATDEEKWQLAIAAYNKDHPKQIRSGYYLSTKGVKAVESFCFLNPNFDQEHPMIKAGTPLHEVNVWPDEEKHPGFRAYQESYYWKAFQLSQVLLRGFALALGREEHFFDEYLTKEDTLSSVVLIRYPYLDPYPPVKTATDGTLLSFERHEDVSLITVLYQSRVDNLQVQMPDGKYLDIPASDDCYLINAGSYLDYITNGYYRAPVHRVKFVNAERLSLPFFVNLGQHSTIEPFTPHNMDAAKNAKPAVPYGQYLREGLLELIRTNGQT